MRDTKVAVFIDAENLPVRCAGEIIDIACGYGRLIERRAYGDFSRDGAQPWVDAAARHALSLQTAVSSASGKNGADILLAMVYPEFKAQQFGAPNLSSLLKRCDFIETQMHGTNRMQIRMKRNG